MPTRPTTVKAKLGCRRGEVNLEGARFCCHDVSGRVRARPAGAPRATRELTLCSSRFEAHVSTLTSAGGAVDCVQLEPARQTRRSRAVVCSGVFLRLPMPWFMANRTCAMRAKSEQPRGPRLLVEACAEDLCGHVRPPIKPSRRRRPRVSTRCTIWWDVNFSSFFFWQLLPLMRSRAAGAHRICDRGDPR